MWCLNPYGSNNLSNWSHKKISLKNETSSVLILRQISDMTCLLFQLSDTTRNPRPGEENGKGTVGPCHTSSHSLQISSSAVALCIWMPPVCGCRLPLCYTGGDADRNRQWRVHRERRILREHVRDEQGRGARRPGQEPYMYTWHRHAGCEEHKKDRPQSHLHLHPATIHGHPGKHGDKGILLGFTICFNPGNLNINLNPNYRLWTSS